MEPQRPSVSLLKNIYPFCNKYSVWSRDWQHFKDKFCSVKLAPLTQGLFSNTILGFDHDCICQIYCMFKYDRKSFSKNVEIKMRVFIFVCGLTRQIEILSFKFENKKNLPSHSLSFVDIVVETQINLKFQNKCLWRVRKLFSK